MCFLLREERMLMRVRTRKGHEGDGWIREWEPERVKRGKDD
jgi:hypothetical protein